MLRRPAQGLRDQRHPADLSKVFADDYPSIASGDTRRKAITFFLHAARKAGSNSAHTSRPHARGRVRRARRRPRDPLAKRTAENPATGGAAHAPEQPTAGYSRTVELRSGGTVTLSWNVNMAFSSDDDEEFVLSLVRGLRSHESSSESNQPQGRAS